MSLEGSDAVVLGVDMGTTATKVVAFDASGRTHGAAMAAYPLLHPRPGEAVQDPETVLRAVVQSVREVAAQATAAGVRVVGLSCSGAMHSLLAVDGAGRPLTPALTWADERAAAQAERLRGAAGGLDLHRRTGTPLHPMAPLPKLVWFREQDPSTFAAARRWAGLKDYVLERLTGAWVIDHSTASGTGMLDLETLDWDAEALGHAGVDAARLPELVPVTHVLSLLPEAAADLGLSPGMPVVAGGGDGPLANLGLGAILPGVAAVSIGTSGALRAVVERPAVDDRGRVFCYALVPGRWVVGGAINNGGVVLRWLRDVLAPELDRAPEEALLELAARVPPGSDGLLMLPYLLGERAPHWSSLARGAYVGLRGTHGRGHLVRAALEGVCLQLALVLASLRDAGVEVREVRATGGFARSALWRQLLADALGMQVGFPAAREGSAYGAALLGMQALGLIEDVAAAAQLVAVEELLRPDPEAAATYAALLPVFAGLYDALTPAFRALGD